MATSCRQPGLSITSAHTLKAAANRDTCLRWLLTPCGRLRRQANLAELHYRLIVMGIHHFKLDVVPRAVLERHLSSGDSEVSIEELEWLPDPNFQPSASFLAQLRELLPNDTSWGPCEEYESDSDWGSDLRIWHAEEDNGHSPVDQIQFRFSTVGDPIELLHRFVSLAASENCVLIDVESGSWFEPVVENAEEYLLNSRAYSFARDPKGTVLALDHHPAIEGFPQRLARLIRRIIGV